MLKRLGFCLSLALMSAAPTAQAQVVQEYIVVLKPVATLRDALGLPQIPILQVVQGTLAQLGVSSSLVDRQYTSALLGFSARLPESLAKQLQTHGLVDFVEPVQTFSITQTVPAAAWHLDRIDQANLPLNGTYNSTRDGSGVRAYILDSGLNATHDEFTGRVGNGFDAVAAAGGSGGLIRFGGGGLLGSGGSAAPGTGTSQTTNPNDPSSNPSDCNGHGSHVAGLVGGTQYGVAKKVRLHAVRVVNCNGTGSTSTVLAGLDWVVANGVKPAVINMSLGGAASQALDRATKNASDQQFVVVAASGNNTRNACNYSPGREPSVINVSATERNDRLASYSNTGPCVDILAPGSDLPSAAHNSRNGVVRMSGTSMASPVVAGAAAKLLQAGVPADQVQIQLIEQAERGKITAVGSTTPNRLLQSK